MSDAPVSFPMLVMPKGGYPEAEPGSPEGGISFGTGYWPERLLTDLGAEWRRMTKLPVPRAEAVTITLDGAPYEGYELSARGIRVAAAWIDRRLLVVSVNGWEGPLELEMVTPRPSAGQQEL